MSLCTLGELYVHQTTRGSWQFSGKVQCAQGISDPAAGRQGGGDPWGREKHTDWSTFWVSRKFIVASAALLTSYSMDGSAVTTTQAETLPFMRL